MILAVVLYGRETFSFILREEHRLMVFENRVLRKIFLDKRDKGTGEWRKLRQAKLRPSRSSPDIICLIKSRCTRWTRRVARMGKERNICVYDFGGET
jgi:hypothetical protein